jgi:hypothetical protein
MTQTNTLAYYVTLLIKVLKSFRTQAIVSISLNIYFFIFAGRARAYLSASTLRVGS